MRPSDAPSTAALVREIAHEQRRHEDAMEALWGVALDTMRAEFVASGIDTGLRDPARRAGAIRALADWVINLCLGAGSETHTAYQVAALIVRGLSEGEPRADDDSSSEAGRDQRRGPRI